MDHSCPWCPVEPRALYAVAYNAVLALDMARAGIGDQERADRKLAELRHYVMDEYGPQVNAHFDALAEPSAYGPSALTGEPEKKQTRP